MEDTFNNVNWDEAVQQPEPLEFKDNDPSIYPPSIYFSLRNKRKVFILPGEFSLRVGEEKHALKPYTIINVHRRTYPEREIPEGQRDIKPDPGADGFDPVYCKINRDYVLPSSKDYFEIGDEFLKDLCKEAEQKDREFAMTIQGLLNTNLNYVWACIDPDFDPHDRLPLWHLYVKTKLEMHMTQTLQEQSLREILYQHKIFCKEWVHKHYKTITPVIMSACNMVVNKSMNVVPLTFQSLPPSILSTMFWRNDQTHGLFAECVYWQITYNDQSKGGRNPSYKQMNVVTHAHAQCYYKLIRQLNEINWSKTWGSVLDKSQPLHPDTIDWYNIIGQIPDMHSMFRSIQAQHHDDPDEEPEKDSVQFLPRWRQE